VTFRTAPASFDSPVQPDNRPNGVAGDTNGLMPSRDLVGVAPGCQAARAAAPSLGLLLATARDEGVALGTEQCYRPLSEQVSVRKRWTSAGNSACAAPVATAPSGAPKGTSMHGWGEAADFGAPGGLTFDSPGYGWLTTHAGRFGWNHPAWARPGGSLCPEAWHWEWVGDGGTMGQSSVRADVVGLLPAPDGLGYSIVTSLGAVRSYGDATTRGSLVQSALGWLIAGACRTPDGGGYWLAGVDGSVYGFGDVRSLGSTRAKPTANPVVGVAAAADGKGYWLATSAGNVFGIGTAAFHGSPAASGSPLTRPIVAIANTPTGDGYWLADSGGRVFAYGGASFYGDASRRAHRSPVISMASTPDGRGYWLADAEGRVFAHGDAPFLGSIPHRITLREPVVAIAGTSDAGGYWLVAADGRVFAFGDAPLYGGGPRPRTIEAAGTRS